MLTAAVPWPVTLTIPEPLETRIRKHLEHLFGHNAGQTAVLTDHDPGPTSRLIAKLDVHTVVIHVDHDRDQVLVSFEDGTPILSMPSFRAHLAKHTSALVAKRTALEHGVQLNHHLMQIFQNPPAFEFTESRSASAYFNAGAIELELRYRPTANQLAEASIYCGPDQAIRNAEDVLNALRAHQRLILNTSNAHAVIEHLQGEQNAQLARQVDMLERVRKMLEGERTSTRQPTSSAFQVSKSKTRHSDKRRHRRGPPASPIQASPQHLGYALLALGFAVFAIVIRLLHRG